MRALFLSKVPLENEDLGCSNISCAVGQFNIEKALQNLGASVKLLSYSVYKQLGSKKT